MQNMSHDQYIHDRSGRARAGDDSRALLAGAATAVAGVGAALALTDGTSVLRAPFTVFFLLAAPAAALAAALPRLDPLSRTVVALVGALAVDLLTAQLMLATHAWSARGGVVAVGALSLAGLAARAIGAGGTRGAGGAGGAGGIVRAAGGTADGTGGPGAAGPYEAPGAPAPVPGGEEGGGDRLESPGVRRDG